MTFSRNFIKHSPGALAALGVNTTCQYAVRTAAYQKQVWRICPEDEYIELGTNATFNDIAVDVGETKAPSVNKNPSNATWANYTDFDYTITSGSEYVSYNASTHKFTGIAPGIAIVTATHKTTGITNSFSITICENQILLRLFSSSEGATGHAWIQITNKTKNTINVGACAIEYGEEITIGKFGVPAVTGVEFEGVWYNRESYFYYNGEYTYPRITRSISVIIDNVDLESINSYISSTYNTYALVGDNCVDFAIHIWNIASPVNITTQDVALIASLPKNLTTYIAEHFDNHESNVVLSAPTIYGYYDGATFVDLLG